MIGNDIILEVKDKFSRDIESESFINQLLKLPEGVIDHIIDQIFEGNKRFEK